MKKRYVIASLALIFLGIGTSACSSSAKSHSEQTAKKETKFNKFTKNIYTTQKGTLTIKKVTNIQVHDPNESGSDANYNIVVLVASFKNNSKKSISANDFFSNNMKLEQKFKNSTHEIDTSSGADNEDVLKKYTKLIKAASDKVDPGKTVEFALDFDISSDNGDKLSDSYLLQPIKPSSDDDLGKAVKFKANTEKLTLEKDSDDSNDEDDSDTEEETTWEETTEESTEETTWEEDE